MPNHLKKSAETTPVPARHGKEGYVFLRADVKPEVKDKLISIAERDGTTFVAVVRDALDFYLDAVEAA